jgi:hypothetical protein
MQKISDFLYKYGDLILILLVSTAIRVKDIVKYEFWYDEAYTGLLLKTPWKAFLAEISVDSHPPLYYFLMRGWTYFSLRFSRKICPVDIYEHFLG